MTDTPKLPIKVVFSAQEDYHKNEPGGGPRKVFGEVTPEVRTDLAGRIASLEKHFASSFKADPDVPAVAKVVLKEKALAKSHRPKELFNSQTCPIIGTRRFGELLVSITPCGLAELSHRVRSDTTKMGEAAISTIERVEPYTAADALGPETPDHLSGVTKRGERALKLRLFAHGDSETDAKVTHALERLTDRLDVGTPELLHYGSNLRIFRVAGVKTTYAVRELAGFVGVQSLSGFPMYRVVKTASTIVRALSSNDFPPPVLGEEYPTVGLIDSGTNPDDPLLEPWVTARHNYVPPGYENHDHGSFVAGLLVHAKALNHGDARFPQHSTRIVDVAAVPGKGGIAEDELLTILEEVIPQHSEVKVWNISLATQELCRNVQFSDLAVALDRLQEQYRVVFVLAAGNYSTSPLRGWPSDVCDEADRICAPADSLRGLTVGSLAHLDNASTRVRSGQPSPFSRRGPGPMFVPKPEVTHYGGNCDRHTSYAQTGVLSVDGSGNVAENVGTSFAAPLVTSLAGHVGHALAGETSSSLLKAFVVHSAVLKSSGVTAEELRYRGFGVPQDVAGVLGCEPWCATLVFEPNLHAGFWFGKEQFPMPACLRDANGRLRGELAMTLVYEPPLDPAFGSEYSRTNVEASLGTYGPDKSGKMRHQGQVPPEPQDINKMYEKNLVEHGFKWSPVKVYRRRIPRGISGEEWRLRMSVQHRQGFSTDYPQSVALIVSVFDPKREQPVYNDVVTAMARNGWVTADLQLRAGLRLRP